MWSDGAHFSYAPPLGPPLPAQGSRSGAHAAQPANMRVTRQRAARERLHQQQQQQQAQQQQVVAQQAQSAPASDSACDMMVEPESFNLDPLTVRDPQLCHHYTKEIYSYLRDLELEHRVAPQFMQVRTPGVQLGPLIAGRRH